MINNILVDFECSPTLKVRLIKFVKCTIRGTNPVINVAPIDASFILKVSLYQHGTKIRFAIFDRKGNINNTIVFPDESVILNAIDNLERRYIFHKTGSHALPDKSLSNMWIPVLNIVPIEFIELNTDSLLSIYREYIDAFEDYIWQQEIYRLVQLFGTNDINLIADYIYSKML